MKRKKTITKLTLGIIIVSILFIQITNIDSIYAKTENKQNSDLKLQYWTEGIVVSDANISALSSSGLGTEDEPYVIDNLMISTTDSLAVEFDGVSTSTHYILRDSHLIGNTYGVYISDTTSGKASIINCTVEGALTIGGPNAHYLTIHNNTLRSSQGSSFRPGLKFTNNVVYTTSIYSNHLMRIEDEDNIIRNNVFYGNNSPIYLNEIRNSTFENNVFHSAGFHIYIAPITKTSNNTFEGNSINGKPYGFFYNRTGETIDGNQYGQIYIINSMNVKIEGGLSNSSIGVQVHNCTDITVDGITIAGHTGIEVRETYGILIENCILEGYNRGIDFYSVTNGVVQNNHLVGYYIGLEIDSSYTIQINNNTVLDVIDIGIYITDTNDVVVKFNIVTCYVQSAGSDVTIRVDTSDTIDIFYNVFISLGNMTAEPAHELSCTNITWYSDLLQVGNHYSDWNGTGTYTLYGNVGSVDLYPFIDVDGDNLTEFQEVMIYFTNPFEADSDNDGFSDYEEIQAGTDPLDSKDYPGKGLLGLILGLVFGIGLAAGVTVFILVKKGKLKLPFGKKK